MKTSWAAAGKIVNLNQRRGKTMESKDIVALTKEAIKKVAGA